MIIDTIEEIPFAIATGASSQVPEIKQWEITLELQESAVAKPNITSINWRRNVTIEPIKLSVFDDIREALLTKPFMQEYTFKWDDNNYFNRLIGRLGKLQNYTSPLEGEFIGIMGPSGSGKTTLLNLIATIDNPTTGKILINGTQPGKMSDSKMASFRRNNLGIVFQGYNLIDSLSVKENIALPMILENRKVDEIEKRVGELADFLGIKEILEKHPYEISGRAELTQ